MGIPVGSIAARLPLRPLALASAMALMMMAAAAQGQTAHPVPGGCQSPDMSKLSGDDERHAAVRVYLLCLNEQNRSSEAMAGSLSRPLLPGFDSREPMVRPYDPRSSGGLRYPDDHGRGSR